MNNVTASTNFEADCVFEYATVVPVAMYGDIALTKKRTKGIHQVY